MFITVTLRSWQTQNYITRRLSENAEKKSWYWDGKIQNGHFWVKSAFLGTQKWYFWQQNPLESNYKSFTTEACVSVDWCLGSWHQEEWWSDPSWSSSVTSWCCNNGCSVILRRLCWLSTAGCSIYDSTGTFGSSLFWRTVGKFSVHRRPGSEVHCSWGCRHCTYVRSCYCTVCIYLSGLIYCNKSCRDDSLKHIIYSNTVLHSLTSFSAQLV